MRNPAAVVTQQPAGSAEASSRILDVLIELDYGLTALPPATLAPEKAARAIDFALDQLEDYAANGCRTLWLATDATAAAADLSTRLRGACARRRLSDLEVIDIGTLFAADAVRVDPLLRTVAREPRPAPAPLRRC